MSSEFDFCRHVPTPRRGELTIEPSSARAWWMTGFGCGFLLALAFVAYL